MGMLVRTAGVGLKQTEALFVEAVETEGGMIANLRRSARDEGSAADMGKDSHEVEAGRTAAGAGRG
jgi:hypothetical protein